MSSSDNRGSGGGVGRRHRDAAPPLPPQPNVQPSGPGQVTDARGAEFFARLRERGTVAVNWATDVPTGQLPAEAGNPPPQLASYVDVSPPRPADPGPTQSPPATMGRHPHLESRRKG
jgi:hypothetical protein